MYMEVSQGNSLCSYTYLRQAKMSCFSFYLFSFFFYKIGEQEIGQVLPRGLAAELGGDDRGKGLRR
jgi:hypothetical protein